MDNSKTLTTTFEMLILGIGLLFNFWFMLILSPLTWRKKNILQQMFLMWLVLAGMRLLLLFSNQEPLFKIIPETINTASFVIIGPLLLISIILQRSWQHKQFQNKANSLRQIDDFLKLNPKEFENMIVELYERAGHKAKRTGTTGDHGVDVVVNAKNEEKWVVQCKRWRGSVGEPIVRDFYGVVQHEKADKGIIITTGRFTAPAREWAKGKPIALYDGDKLVELWERAKAAQVSKKETTLATISPVKE